MQWWREARFSMFIVNYFNKTGGLDLKIAYMSDKAKNNLCLRPCSFIADVRYSWSLLRRWIT